MELSEQCIQDLLIRSAPPAPPRVDGTQRIGAVRHQEADQLPGGALVASHVQVGCNKVDPVAICRPGVDVETQASPQLGSRHSPHRISMAAYVIFRLPQGPDAMDNITGQKCVRCIVHHGDSEGVSV